MKKLLFVLALFISVKLSAQEPTYRLNSPTKVPGRFYADSALLIPFRDTSYKPLRPGGVILFSGDSSFYQWNGFKWTKVTGTGGGGSVSNVGSGASLVKSSTEIKSIVDDYGTIHTPFTTEVHSKVDTTEISGLLTNKDGLRKLDSVMGAHSIQPGYGINGAASLVTNPALKIDTGANGLQTKNDNNRKKDSIVALITKTNINNGPLSVIRSSTDVNVQKLYPGADDPISQNDLVYNTFTNGYFGSGWDTTHATNTTISFPGFGELKIVGGNIADHIFSTYSTILHRWRAETKFRIGSIGGGDYIMLEILGTGGPIWAQIKASDLSGLWQQVNSAYPLGTTAAQGVTAINDIVLVSVERTDFTLTFTISNLTQNTTLSNSYTYGHVVTGYGFSPDPRTDVLNPAGGPAPMRNISVGIKPIAGTFYIDYIRLINTQRVGADVVFFTHSVGDGFSAQNADSTYYMRAVHEYPYMKFALHALSGSEASAFNGPTGYLKDFLKQTGRTAVIMMGINEVQNGTSQGTFIANLQSMVDTLEAHGWRVFVFNMTPYDFAHSASVISFNTAINSTFGSRVIDIYSVLNTSGKNIYPGGSTDSIHFSPAGHRKIFEVLRDTLYNNFNFNAIAYRSSSSSGGGGAKSGDGVTVDATGRSNLGGNGTNPMIVTGAAVTMPQLTATGKLFANNVGDNLEMNGGGTDSTKLSAAIASSGAFQYIDKAGTRGFFVHSWASGNGSIDMLGNANSIFTAKSFASTFTSTFNYVGANIRVRFDGTDPKDWGIVTGGSGALQIANWNGDYGLIMKEDGNAGFFGERLQIGGFAPTASLHMAASTTSYASFRVPSGTAPTSPNHGDGWTDANHFYMRLNGVTKQIDDQIYTTPDTTGHSGQFLQYLAPGGLQWGTPSGGGGFSKKSLYYDDTTFAGNISASGGAHFLSLGIAASPLSSLRIYGSGTNTISNNTEYLTNVGANFTARSLVDKNFVDSSIASIHFTFGNGLTLSGLAVSNDYFTGKAGGLTAKGGTAASENLTLMSTNHATKGKILFGNSAYDEVNNRLILNDVSGTEPLNIGKNSGTNGSLALLGSTSGKVIIKTAAAAGTSTFTLPTDDGGPGQVLASDGSGILSWADQAGGASPSTIHDSLVANTNYISNRGTFGKNLFWQDADTTKYKRLGDGNGTTVTTTGSPDSSLQVNLGPLNANAVVDGTASHWGLKLGQSGTEIGTFQINAQSATVSSTGTVILTGTAVTLNGGNTEVTAGFRKSAKQIITSGSSATITANTPHVIFNPSGTITNYTLTFPASPSDGDEVDISAGGTLTSGTIITTFTLSPNSGQDIVQLSAPTTLVYGDAMIFYYDANGNHWRRTK